MAVGAANLLKLVWHAVLLLQEVNRRQVVLMLPLFGACCLCLRHNPLASSLSFKMFLWPYLFGREVLKKVGGEAGYRR